MSGLDLVVQGACLRLLLEDLLWLPARVALASDQGHTDLEAINDELARLREGRAYFMEWVREFRDQEPRDRRGLSPWAFLTAWNHSTTRIIYLLRERRGLAGHKETEFDPIMEAVFERLERHAGVEALTGVGEPSAAESAAEGLDKTGEGASGQ